MNILLSEFSLKLFFVRVFTEHESCLFVCYDQRSRVQRQSESGIGRQRDVEEQEEDLGVLLREQESVRRLKK